MNDKKLTRGQVAVVVVFCALIAALVIPMVVLLWRFALA